jgi:AraC-like DNA-binding protein
MTASFTAGLSGAFTALTVLLGLLAWRDARRELSGRLLAALCLSVSALELSTGPMSSGLSTYIGIPLRLMGGFNVGLLWLFCLSLLRDGFQLRGREWFGFGLFSLGPLGNMVDFASLPGANIVSLLFGIMPLLALGHIVFIALSERADDLLEGRQNGRIMLSVLLALAALVSVLSETLSDPDIANLLRICVAGIPIAGGGVLWLSSVSPSRLRFEPTPAAPIASQSNVDPRDQVLLNSLIEAMDGGQYRETDLSIEKLADNLKVPTHRLRSVINQGLGYRNFGAFVNSYRLSFTKKALADPQRGRETVLAIAFEAGFASLQTFNRVFKDIEGETPTGYREKRLREAAQNQKMQPISEID